MSHDFDNSDALAIRSITFDLDDTLWDIWPVVVRAEQLLHDWLTVRYPRIPERFNPLELRELCDAIANTQPDIAHDRTLLRKKALQAAAMEVAYTVFDVEAAFAVFHAARNAVELFEDARPALERLAQQYTLASLSNGNADVRLIGLHNVFSFSLNAIDVGVAKPHSLIFETACRLLRVRPEQIVHVGDDPDDDVRGGINAGFRTVWVNRTGRDWPGGPRADAEVRSLAELERVLALWSERSAG